ncbi:MAG: ribosome recycling factor [Acidimicrobiia bacterium]
MVDEELNDAEAKMKKAILATQEEFAGIRSGRANPALLEKLKVEYYGTEMTLVQLAQISAPEPRLLVITPFDKGSIPAIEKAIITSDLGLTPSNDGSVIRVSIPPLTEERRKELVKLVHARAEEGRVAIRNIRRHTRETLEKAKKSGDLPEDEFKRAERKLQELTDNYIGEIDGMLARKEAELLEV